MKCHYDTEKSCPHCNFTYKSDTQITKHHSSMTILLGLTLIGCSDKENDTSTQPLYGVAIMDNDFDGLGSLMEAVMTTIPIPTPTHVRNDSIEGYMKDSDGDSYGDNATTNSNVDDGTDCDDTDASRHPKATETAGDGIDSNCNGNNDN